LEDKRVIQCTNETKIWFSKKKKKEINRINKHLAKLTKEERRRPKSIKYEINGAYYNRYERN
jgi:hypothetical protein